MNLTIEHVEVAINEGNNNEKSKSSFQVSLARFPTEVGPEPELEFDNGANMRGKNIGQQRRVLDFNPRALFVPCNAHTLNLVVSDAAQSSREIVDFFDKALSDTRWESRKEAIRSLHYNLKSIYCSLTELRKDSNRDGKTKYLANSLKLKISSFKFICSIVVWHDLLSKIEIVSKMIQNPNLNLAECCNALKNLQKYITDTRSNHSFDTFISTAATLAEEIDAESERKIKRQFLYESVEDSVSDPKV
ncbi:hypothetical protein ILUMI_25311 [Ignelater luminosus]|uniref:Zinc finger MYM-type 1-like n=1 Tax=Ignelater luminosus TaxID=2038154 RepID=A0A8K0C8T0_IGNLU|nr:hypothetical protein ILUMI_25311 [Ignelater luminosus]